MMCHEVNYIFIQRSADSQDTFLDCVSNNSKAPLAVDTLFPTAKLTRAAKYSFDLRAAPLQHCCNTYLFVCLNSI